VNRLPENFLLNENTSVPSAAELGLSTDAAAELDLSTGAAGELGLSADASSNTLYPGGEKEALKRMQNSLSNKVSETQQLSSI